MGFPRFRFMVDLAGAIGSSAWLEDFGFLAPSAFCGIGKSAVSCVNGVFGFRCWLTVLHSLASLASNAAVFSDAV